jgi:hypothetical protein
MKLLNPNFKLDADLLLALSRENADARSFDVVVGFDQHASFPNNLFAGKGFGLASLGPKTAMGSLTREQLMSLAQLPAVKYLKLVDHLKMAHG